MHADHIAIRFDQSGYVMGALVPVRSQSSFGKTLPQEIIVYRTIKVMDDSSGLARPDEPFLRNQGAGLAIHIYVSIISPWDSSRSLTQHRRFSVTVAPLNLDLVSVEYYCLVDNRKRTTNIDL